MADNERFPVIIVAGPTASGKSALALELAVALGGTVINADSMQVYRELRILTARPSEANEARAPHRLYGVIPAAEACTAARWREMAIDAVGEARAAGRVPIVCGGTGLYLKALMDGLSPIPEIPKALRASLRERYAGATAGEIHAALGRVDPRAAARLRPSDRQRLLRALEVIEATGRSIAEWQAIPPSGPPPGMDFCTILLMPPRRVVYAACDTRFRAMIDAGALEEVRALRGLRLAADLPVMRALGVAELMKVLDGDLMLEAAVTAVQQATRNFVKRQFTWFRRQIITDLCINEKFSEKLMPKIFAFICKKGLTRLP